MNHTNNYNALVDALSDALIIVSNCGIIRWCNYQVSQLLGYVREDITGEPLDILLPPEFREAHSVLINQYFSHPVSRPMGYTRPLRAQTRSGETINVTIALAPIQWDDQQCAVAMLRSHHSDYSQYDAVASLRSVQELFDESQSIAHVGAWDWDIQQGTLYWSDQIFAIFGLEREANFPTYEAFLSYIHPDDRHCVEAAVQSALTDDTPYLTGHRIVRHDSSVRHVIERGKVYRNDNGTPVRMIGTVQDVTEDYDYHMQLKIADSVFKHAFDGAISTDSELRIIRANPAFERMSNYLNQEIEHQPLTDIIPGLDNERIMQAIRKNGFWHGSLHCLKAGGSTFPVHLSIARIDDEAGPGTKFFVITLTDISSIKLHEAQLRKLAYYDSLTSLFNRSYFTQKVSELINSKHTAHSGFAILFIDLDGFKEVNDTQGHQEGDRLLIDIAMKLSAIIEGQGLLSRFGGDEFVILQRSDDLVKISLLARTILDALTFTCDYGMYSFKITASIGIALYPVHGRCEQELIKKADIAMYKAKNSGKNQLTYYIEEYGREKTDRLTFISDLEKAIQENQIRLYLQPIVSGRDEAPTYFEALSRWQHPERGPVAPSEFIPIAEETGLIVPLGESLLRQVKAFMNAWHDSGGGDVRVSFNLSVSQLYAPNLQQIIQTLFCKDRPLSEYLVFEITESSVIDQLDQARTELLKLKDLGCTIALDDFGTGYSSLSYLSKLPIDIVKIDRCFVNNITHSDDNHSICRAIISLSHSLKLEVVAEGIESQEQYLELKNMCCDKMQGYLFGQPEPADTALKKTCACSS